MLGRGAHRQALLGGQPLNADAVPQGGDEAGHLAVRVENGDVVAGAVGVPDRVEPMDRGPSLGQRLRGGLGQDRLQVDVVGPNDRRRLLRKQHGGRLVGVVVGPVRLLGVRERAGRGARPTVVELWQGGRHGQRVLPHLLGVAQRGVGLDRPGARLGGGVHAHHPHGVDASAAQGPHEGDAVGPPVLDAEGVSDHQARQAAQQHGQDRAGQGQRAAQDGQPDNDPHGGPAVAHRLGGAALAGAGEQARQNGEDCGDADLGGARGGDRQSGDNGGGAPVGHHDEGRQGQDEAAQAAQKRLPGGAPGAAQEVGQDDGHGHREGRQPLNGLQGEDEDLAQDDGERVAHVEGDRRGRRVRVGGQDEHGGGADDGQGEVEQVLGAAQAVGRGVHQEGG